MLKYLFNMDSNTIKSKAKKNNNSKENEIVIPDNIDTLTYFSPHINDEIRLAYPIIISCSSEILNKLIQIVLRYIQVGDSFILPSKVYNLDEKYSHKEIDLLLISIYVVIKQAVRSKVKLAVIKNDLTTMKMPSHFITCICDAIYSSRSLIESKASLHRVHYLQLTKLRWRIDVVISSGILTKVLRPTILMQVIIN